MNTESLEKMTFAVFAARDYVEETQINPRDFSQKNLFAKKSFKKSSAKGKNAQTKKRKTIHKLIAYEQYHSHMIVESVSTLKQELILKEIQLKVELEKLVTKKLYNPAKNTKLAENHDGSAINSKKLNEKIGKLQQHVKVLEDLLIEKDIPSKNWETPFHRTRSMVGVEKIPLSKRNVNKFLDKQ